MKILVVCQYYYPEPFRITDICEALAALGHDVTVLTGTPNYPMGKIYDGYQHGAKSEETINGVRVLRCKVIPRKSGPIFRLLNYYSFSFASSIRINSITDDYDVVFINQLSPVMMANAGLKYKKNTGKKMILYCLDLWPESLVAGGIKRDSLIYKLFHIISKKVYLNADKILVTSKSFTSYFYEAFGISGTEYLPQYAEELFSPDKCYKQPNGMLDVMFAGNLGSTQSIDTIIDAAKITVGESIHWHIVGDGSEYEHIKKMAKDLPNVSIYGRQPLERMPELYSKADAMLVTMKDDPVISLTLPGKVQTYMAAGKPIIGSINGETSLVIKESKCGLCGKAEDVSALVNNVRMLANSNDISDMASNSIKYYQDNFSKQSFILKLEKVLMQYSI